jgi:hypothetical protein
MGIIAIQASFFSLPLPQTSCMQQRKIKLLVELSMPGSSRQASETLLRLFHGRNSATVHKQKRNMGLISAQHDSRRGEQNQKAHAHYTRVFPSAPIIAWCIFRPLGLPPSPGPCLLVPALQWSVTPCFGTAERLSVLICQASVPCFHGSIPCVSYVSPTPPSLCIYPFPADGQIEKLPPSLSVTAGRIILLA